MQYFSKLHNFAAATFAATSWLDHQAIIEPPFPDDLEDKCAHMKISSSHDHQSRVTMSGSAHAKSTPAGQAFLVPAEVLA